MTFLRFCLEPSADEDPDRLWLEVRTDQFSGSSYFWSYRHRLLELADELRAFPLTKPILWEWGYERCQGDDAVLRIRITPTESLGALMVYVEIADLYDLETRVSVKLPTTYASLANLQAQLAALALDEADEAALDAGT